jgi:hypothetical protein
VGFCPLKPLQRRSTCGKKACKARKIFLQQNKSATVNMDMIQTLRTLKFLIFVQTISYNLLSLGTGADILKNKNAGREGLHITFHNPNSTEDTVKYLSKIIAGSLAEQVARGLPYQNQCLSDKAPVCKKPERDR